MYRIVPTKEIKEIFQDEELNRVPRHDIKSTIDNYFHKSTLQIDKLNFIKI